MRLLLVLLLAAGLAGQERFAASQALDEVIEYAIGNDELPGAVLWIGHQGHVVHRKAYGMRALTPDREPMTLDTIFDAASLTKVVATTTAVMKLFEQGRIRLNDEVTRYLPEFQGGKSSITVRQLLTHFSGLRSDLDLQPPWSGYDTGVRLALIDKPVAAPGERFIYSDINFILIGEIVQRLSGQSLADYTRKEVIEPLGMKDTMFQPSASLRPRIAPTEQLPGEGVPLRGIVHDPTTRYMGGVAGHAGLFTTAADLARYAAMILGGGQVGGVRLISPLVIHKFTTPQSPADQSILRGFGWDLDSRYSANRGELFPIGSFGHTGFTGTSLWIDPESQSYVILLANSVHPKLRPAISSLRARVATLTAASLGMDRPGASLTGYNETLVGAGVRRVVARNGHALTGLDVLTGEDFSSLLDLRVGLITNHTGLSLEGRRNVDLMVESGVKVVALFSPEHGMAGTADTEQLGDAVDPSTGIPIRSLYQGSLRRPTAEMLQSLDVLVFDIQDIGARFYTYMCTLLYAMEEAARRGLPIVVLDRPNPLTGVHVEGPLLDEQLQSFVGCFPLPLRHGLTLGEIATMASAERGWNAELSVVRMRGWERGDWFDSTGLVWVNPSPNMRSMNAALLYPGLAMLEASHNYSVGRGTDSPFEQVGADWIDARELAGYLNARRIPGVRIYPTRFRPTSSRFAGVEVEGIRFLITHREVFHSARLGLEVAVALAKLHPGKLDPKRSERLIGNRRAIADIEAGRDPEEILQDWQDDLAAFLERRKRYLLYR